MHQWRLLFFSFLFFLPLVQAEKTGFTEIDQQDQTCLPTSTAVLLFWFATHGYPNLSNPDWIDTDAHKLRTLCNDVMKFSAIDFFGPRDGWTSRYEEGIENFATTRGYHVGLKIIYLPYEPNVFHWSDFAANAQPNVGFVLGVSACRFDADRNAYTADPRLCHAVTLMNEDQGVLTIHDSAHLSGEEGRRTLTSSLITSGTYSAAGCSAPAQGLYLLDGSVMSYRPEGMKLVLCLVIEVTMNPLTNSDTTTAVP